MSRYLDEVPPVEICPHGDPLCPCPDGDPCHYWPDGSPVITTQLADIELRTDEEAEWERLMSQPAIFPEFHVSGYLGRLWDAGLAKQFIEHWEPQIGDRVLIHLNGECLIPALEGSPAAAAGVMQGHLEYEDGLRGTVVSLTAYDPEMNAIGHRILVRYDERWWLGDREVIQDYYAVAELELLRSER